MARQIGTQRRHAAARAAAVLASALTALAAACSAPQPPVPAEPEDQVAYRGAPQPPGSVLDEPGIAPEEAFDVNVRGWPGSLRPGDDAARDGAHLRRIRERGRIIVGVDQSMYLLSYRDPARGDLHGFEVDLAHEVAKDIFGDPDKVDFRFVDSANRTDALRSGSVDIVIRTMSVTPSRAAQVDFSTPYLSSYVRMLAPKDRGIESADDLAGRTVCVVDNTNVLNLVRERFGESKVLRVRSWSDCLMATQQFLADAVVADDAVLAGMAAQDPLTEIYPAELAKQLYAVAAPRGHDDLVRQVNFTIERLRTDGTWGRMFEQWLGASLADAWPPNPMYREEGK